MTILAEFSKAFKSVTKDLLKEKKRRERDARAVSRAPADSGVSLKAAVFKVLREAVGEATGNGKVTVSTRWLFYPVRRLIQKITAKELSLWDVADYLSRSLMRGTRPLTREEVFRELIVTELLVRGAFEDDDGNSCLTKPQFSISWLTAQPIWLMYRLGTKLALSCNPNHPAAC